MNAKEQENCNAWLHTISACEGTLGLGNDGYDILVGSNKSIIHRFTNYDDHPRIKVWIKSIGNYSTAAGRYQVLAKTFDYFKTAYGITDFSPKSQDKIALTLTNERHALDDIKAGRVVLAAHKCRKIWASLPDANYPNQKTRSVDFLKAAFVSGGGVLADNGA